MSTKETKFQVIQGGKKSSQPGKSSLICDKGEFEQALNESVQSLQVAEERSAYDVFQIQSKSLKKEDHNAEVLAQWSKAIDNIQARSKLMRPDGEAIVYLLSVIKEQQLSYLKVEIAYAKKRKCGRYGSASELPLDGLLIRRLITTEDKHIFNTLYATEMHPDMGSGEFHYQLHDCCELLQNLLQTGRAYWVETSKYPLTHGKSRKALALWQQNKRGEQFLQFFDEDNPSSKLIVLPTNPPWYFDASSQQLGQLVSDIAAEPLLWLVNMPLVKPECTAQIQQQLDELMPQVSDLPKLKQFSFNKKVKKMQPKVKLRLYGRSIGSSGYTALPDFMQDLPYGVRNGFGEGPYLDAALVNCRFDYAGNRVELSQAEDKVISFDNDELYYIVRDRDYERKCVEKLVRLGLEAVALNPQLSANYPELQFSFTLAEIGTDEEELAQKVFTLESLAAKEGWSVKLDYSFPATITHEVDEWYSNIAESGSGIDWFELDVGVLVNGEPVNILPLLLAQMQTDFKGLTPQQIRKLPDDTPCEMLMLNGQYLKIPFERIRNILLVLCELYSEKPLEDAGHLKLSRLKASLLPEIEKAVGATRMRWLGETKLKEFGDKLANFSGIKPVKPPKNFNAILRPYQQDGLNWLQFLRQYQLNGVLADDMGLGKTVQTLAHLCLEKEKKRLKKPSLLIAPTSLMTNWINEAQKFSPDLKLLLLHGNNRHQQFAKIEQADVVLTTYPLILRDKDTLLKHEYQYIILDEAHQIKNSQAKMTQIILQLKGVHRLCLTGTPMENHLGELWSLFNFLLPGLLGTKRQFQRLFRTPIEKYLDQSSHQQLAQRVKPFLLRRKKADVVKDLPEKTEIIRRVKLNSEQRDLYESVRLAMESKVRNAINEKGMNRSQIIILDALLKLRQVCCSPSLLKLEQAKKVRESAKLEDLMSFVPNLVEEGRRILIFSTFTSMLALIEEQLNVKQLPYVKLTGQTKDRKTPINQFQDKQVPIFLISLKAGGVGLNLTSADTVIHYDPWWNPAAENQATDRVHRIGQKNPVFVYKMIAEGTVEEKILEMQNKKSSLVEGVLENNKQTKLQLTPQDLDNLFKPLA